VIRLSDTRYLFQISNKLKFKGISFSAARTTLASSTALDRFKTFVPYNGRGTLLK